MKFRTEIESTPLSKQISYQSPTLALGSCFATQVGARMAQAKLPIVTNPTGVLFNPASIAQTLKLLSGERQISPEELICREGIYSHYQVHGSLSATTPERCLEQIEEAIAIGGKALRAAEWVILTLGSAWIYELRDSGEVVANCHKMAAATFTRRALTIEQIGTSIDEMVGGALKGKNIIITLSPIRHLSDGLEENSLSKALLRVAIAEAVERHENLHYFPSYEIMMDDLRDYRFYGEDMVHPSSTAVDYIWQHFSHVAISPEALSTMERVMRVVRGAAHRPLKGDSEPHRHFCLKQLSEIESLAEIEFGKERAYFLSQLEKFEI